MPRRPPRPRRRTGVTRLEVDLEVVAPGVVRHALVLGSGQEVCPHGVGAHAPRRRRRIEVAGEDLVGLREVPRRDRPGHQSRVDAELPGESAEVGERVPQESRGRGYRAAGRRGSRRSRRRKLPGAGTATPAAAAAAGQVDDHQDLTAARPRRGPDPAGPTIHPASLGHLRRRRNAAAHQGHTHAATTHGLHSSCPTPWQLPPPRRPRLAPGPRGPCSGADRPRSVDSPAWTSPSPTPLR